METQQLSTGEPAAERGGSVGKHQPKPARRWWHVAGSLLFAAFALFLVFAAVVVNVQHWKLEPVLSGSMRPGIQPGDLAIVRPVPLNEIGVGTVIAYQPPEQPRPVLHRIVEMSGTTILTKGDANNVADPWGKVTLQSGDVDRLVGVVPKVGFLLDVRSLLLKIVGGVIVVAAGLWIWALFRERSKARGETAGLTRNNEEPETTAQLESALAMTDGEAREERGSGT
jgi:signal peptidase